MQTASNGHTATQRPVVHAPAPARALRGLSAVSSWPFCELVNPQKELSKSSTLFRRLRRTSLIASATATASAAQATTPSIASFSSNSVISFPSDSFFALLAAFAFVVFALQLLAHCVCTIWIHPFIKGAATQSGKRSAARLGGEAQASAAPHGNHGDNKPSRSATE